jgi:hypothetical protein
VGGVGEGDGGHGDRDEAGEGRGRGEGGGSRKLTERQGHVCLGLLLGYPLAGAARLEFLTLTYADVC